MDSLAKRAMALWSRSPLWAITPEGFVRFLQLARGSLGYSQSLQPAAKLQSSKLAIIPVQGVLTKDCAWAGTTYNAVHDALEKAAADPKVGRIVLAVDSPGGEVTGLPETAAALASVAKVKPVSAIVEGMAASAAYWLTSQANDITLTPSGEVGSVGVRMMHSDISKSLADAGIKITELYSGDFKTEWTPFSPVTDEAKADMQARLDTVHANFLKDVGQGRGTRAGARIRANRFGEGRMFDGQEALSRGLVDALQSPRDFYRAITRQDTDDPESSTRLRRARLELERIKFQQ